VTHTMSATSTLRVHPTRSVRRTSGLVLVGNPDTGGELKSPCAAGVFQPLLQRGYAESFMRAGNSRFPLALGTPTATP